MKAKLVRIGNSKGIRIPKSLIEEFNFQENVELDIQPDGLLIRSSQKPRYQWAAAFEMMAKNGDDAVLNKTTFSNSWDGDEWEW